MANRSHSTAVTVEAEDEAIRRMQELSMRDAANIERRIPTEQDFLIAYATFPGTFGFIIVLYPVDLWYILICFPKNTLTNVRLK